MASKPLIIASLIGASIGVPYVASRNSGSGDAATNQATRLPSTSAPAASLLGPSSTSATPSAISTPALAATPLSSAMPRSPSAEQALQFNVTKEWVYRSWDRKSTGPTDLGLFSIRVPMVSGTQTASLAGSLTYYFNTQNQVEHISFRGRTGDPSRLVRFLMQTYQFQPISSQPGEQVYQVSDGSGVLSELRTRPEPIVAGSPHGAHSVELELARPGSQRYLPPRGPFIHVPQTPDSAQSAASNAGTSSSVTPPGSSGSEYLNNIRYATPQEEGQANRMRWPN